MPFDTPTLPQLIERADADLAGATDQVLRRSDQIVLGRVHAGATHELHGYLAFVAKQILPDECEEDMLVRYAKLRLRVPRRDAVAATGPIAVVGQVGAVIDKGVVLQYADGRRYVVNAPVTLTAAQAAVPVNAVEPGVAGNLAPGATLELVSPVLGITPSATVLAPGITGGTDQEGIEALRQRVIRSFRIVPDGGNADDYETWAREVAGITRAWCRRHYMGLGTVGVFVMRDDDPDPIPSQASLDAVRDHIEAEKPVTAELYVLAPKAKPIHFQIRLSPDTTATRAAVEQSLRDLLKREGDLGVTVLRTHLAEAISQSPGENDHQLIAPADNVALAPNEIPTFGGVAWL
ncbi:baseplate J/gp47 family protein [Cupriavidus gilardii]|uniref:baseplate J/gp47 family protein n=1 Tax=Cupriavidus gilardii TaxID=82541 RepID=UPI0007E48F81|nr:baseplate J/gp47 family protein [Cupriavidus gilardii]